MAAQILILGSAFVDVMLRVDAVPPSGGEALAQLAKTAAGGCAYNVSNVLRELKLAHQFFAPVGAGPYAEIVKAQMRADGLKITACDPNYDCGVCYCLIEPDGERTFLTVQGVEMHYRREWLEALPIKSADLLYACGYELEGDNGELIAESFFHKKPEAKLIIDLGPRGAFMRSEVWQRLLSLKPLIHCNQEELLTAAACRDPEKAAQILIANGAQAVVATLNAEGALCCERDRKPLLIPSLKVQAVDSNGAGDSHTAGVIAGLSLGMSLEESTRLGNRIAAIMVTQSGARLKLPQDFSLN